MSDDMFRIQIPEDDTPLRPTHKPWPGPRPNGVHNVRPWWRLQQVQSRLAAAGPKAGQPLTFCFVRMDGKASSPFMTAPQRDGRGAATVTWPDGVNEELAALDNEAPLPIPTPTPLQTFLRIEDGHLVFWTITDMIFAPKRQVWNIDGTEFTPESWRDFLYAGEYALISGHGHPWAAPGFVETWSAL